MHKSKRGLSPVVTTALLILVAIILFIIIMVWVKSFIKEQVEKDLGGGPEPIQNFCDKVQFSADIYIDADGPKVSMENNGDVPIYGVEVKVRKLASIKSAGIATHPFSVKSGDTIENIEVLGDGSGEIAVGNKVTLVPILLGEGTSEQKMYTCDNKYGIEAEVQSA